MNALANETLLTGSWTMVNGRVIEDEVCLRIRLIIEKQLQHVATAQSGWEELYRDPSDGRYWELTYLQGEMQGGGPPSLRLIPFETAERKYHCV
jgi:hypothetical protein